MPEKDDLIYNGTNISEMVRDTETAIDSLSVVSADDPAFDLDED